MNDINSNIVDRFKQGDETAFRAIFDAYYLSVKRNIVKFIQDQEDVEDILQDVFIHLWLSRNTLAENSNVGNWLFVVSYNRSMSHIKKVLKSNIASLTTTTYSEALTAEHTLDSHSQEDVYSQKLNQLKTAIDKLPEQRKVAFVLHKLKGYSYSEVSDMMGISESSVRQYVKLAKSTLSKKVKLYNADLAIFLILLINSAINILY